MSSMEALHMIQSLLDFVFAKGLALSHVETLDALENDVGRIHSRQAKLTDFGFFCEKL